MNTLLVMATPNITLRDVGVEAWAVRCRPDTRTHTIITLSAEEKATLAALDF